MKEKANHDFPEPKLTHLNDMFYLTSGPEPKEIQLGVS